MFISHYNGHGIKLARPLSTVDNTRDYMLVYPTVDSGLTITYTHLYSPKRQHNNRNTKKLKYSKDSYHFKCTYQ